jgi:glycosyltransferase involved in cell wall biosynthesis
VKNVIRLPEQCFDKVPDLIPKKFEKLKIIWIGELVSRKQLEILLQATSNLEIPYEIHIVGDGPLKLHYIKMAQKYNVNSKFYGKINRDEVFNLLKTSHVLAHTSYREGTATTILEALSMNNFVIAHKIGGQDLVVRSNGMILDLISFDYSVKMFSEQLTKLYYGVIDDKIKFNLSASNFLTWENLFNEILKSYL